MNVWAQARPGYRWLLPMLRKAMKRAVRACDIGGTRLNLVIIDDDEIADLNRRFLGCNGSTDVIAFPGEGNLIGEIAISSDTARRQARERGAPLVHEMTLLAVHGLLHLSGMDDTSLAQWKKMKQVEFEMMMKIL